MILCAQVSTFTDELIFFSKELQLRIKFFPFSLLFNTFAAMKHLFFVILLALNSTAYASIYGLIEPKVAWSKKQLSVCFATYADKDKTQLVDDIPANTKKEEISAFSAQEMDLIKTQIEKEYTSDRTGITFSGWQTCKESPDSDVYLFKLTTRVVRFLGIASMGEGGVRIADKSSPNSFTHEKSNDKRKPVVALNFERMFAGKKLTRDEEIKLFATHEFGHLAGLRHEHILSPKDLEQNCETTNFVSSEEVDLSTKRVAKYDANSVMNYCFVYLLINYGTSISTTESEAESLFLFEDTQIVSSTIKEDEITFKLKIGLSQGDVHSLNCLYKYDQANIKKYCVPSYNPRK